MSCHTVTCAGMITSVMWNLQLIERFYLNHNFVVKSYKKGKVVWPILPAQYTRCSPSSYIKCHKCNHERTQSTQNMIHQETNMQTMWVSLLLQQCGWGLHSSYMRSSARSQKDGNIMHRLLCLERTASCLTRLEIYEIPYMHCRTLTWSLRFLLKHRHTWTLNVQGEAYVG